MYVSHMCSTWCNSCCAQLLTAAARGNLAAVRSLVEEQERDVEEKDWVRYLLLEPQSLKYL